MKLLPDEKLDLRRGGDGDGVVVAFLALIRNGVGGGDTSGGRVVLGRGGNVTRKAWNGYAVVAVVAVVVSNSAIKHSHRFF